MKKRFLSLLIAVVIAISSVPVNGVVTAAAVTTQTPNTAIITVEGAWSKPGDTVAVNITIKDNPGIQGATLTVSWEDGLVPVSDASGEAFSGLEYFPPSRYTQTGTNFIWYGNDAGNAVDGTILTMTFQVSETAGNNELFDIAVTYVEGDVFDGTDADVYLEIHNGYIRSITYQPGDVNGDGRVNTRDLVRLSQYISDGCITDPDGYNAVVIADACDVTGDGRVNTRDLVRLSQYISDGCQTIPEGYNATLNPAKLPDCSHTMEATAYKAATCTEPGNISYYHCTSCGKYFNDANGSVEISLENTVLAAAGHTAVTDPRVEPTYESVGWTEGSHCSVCGQTLVPQIEIPKLELNSYSISYSFTDSDPYLQRLVKEGKLVNTNPATYTEKDSFNLVPLSVPGYTFEGWFDGPWADASRVTSISNQMGNVSLYAKWTKITYKIDFDSPDVPIDSIIYTVDTGATLKNPSHFGYTFVGWSLDGKILSSIPVGTIGNLTLHANWTSDRNKAVAVSKYEDPIIIEDMVNGQYLFIYEIGTIQNVPLALVKDLGNTEGISISEEHSYSQTVNETFAKTIAQTVTNATTTTSSWTLSEDWNDTSSATTERGEELGKTKETTDSQGNVVEGKYYVSNVKGGETTNTSSAGGSSGTSSKVTQGLSAGISGSYTSEHTDSTSTELGVDASVSASYQAGPAASRFNAGIEISGHYDKTTSETDTQSATVASDRSKSFTVEGDATNESHWDTSHSSSSSWNSTESYESATSTSTTSEISNAISEAIYNKHGYSSMSERGGEKSNTASTGESLENSNEYSSTVEYSNIKEETFTELVVRQSSATGYYRLVSAGTVHVFAVVGYDLATNSYYTYTYNVLDTERHVYLDYSKETANFNDCENAILPFEVPYNIHEFISGVISRSDGLRINEATGVIEGYDGAAEYVVIPEYVSCTDGNAKPYAVRVTGISQGAFKGNTTVKGVYLPKYVSKIPDYAFAGCTALEVVMGYGVSEIGAHAFDGCINLSSFTIDKYITALGENAFVGVPEIKVNAANEAVADAATKSGAKKITLDITALSAYDNRVIEIPDTVKYFAIIGNSYKGNIATGLTYKNLRINSSADETFISNMIFEDNRNTPLTMEGKKVTLSKVEVKNAPGFALVMKNENIALDLYGTVSLESASGNAVISKNVTLARSNANVSGTLNLIGNYLVCGDVTDSASLLKFTSGELKHISDDEYEAMLTSSILTFDPNGGEVDTTEKRIYFGQPYGTLPTPIRTGYSFAGWYTDATGGTLITEESFVTVLANQKLYAHWEAMAYKVNWNTGTGYTIAVSRTSSPYANAPAGALNNDAVIYYGDVLSITYTASTGYTISSKGSTSVTVTGNVTSSNIYCTAAVNQYKASWNSGTGYTITVKRTSSPLKGASTGTLSSGAAVYHGDVLVISYVKADYYHIVSHGADTITVTGNVTSSHIYATAELNPVSDWVKASEMPSGAQTVNQKWTYTKTTNTESRETSMSGYTQVGSYWVQSGSGSTHYAGFPGGFDTGHWIYTSFAKNPYSAYENETTKREVSNSWAGFVYWHWMYNVWYSNTTSRTIADRSCTFEEKSFVYFFAMTSGVDCPSLGNSYVANYSAGKAPTTYNCHNILPANTSSTDGLGTPRMLRFDYYTSYYTDYYKMFQYRKVENLESNTEVVASDTISNVQKWVQYRAK